MRNGNSIRADFTKDTIKKRLELRLFLFFSDNLTVILEFLTLQDKHNLRTLSEYIKSILTCWETGQKSAPKACFSSFFLSSYISLSVRIMFIYKSYCRDHYKIICLEMSLIHSYVCFRDLLYQFVCHWNRMT
jgi:hypothetical protein